MQYLISTKVYTKAVTARSPKCYQDKRLSSSWVPDTIIWSHSREATLSGHFYCCLLCSKAGSCNALSAEDAKSDAESAGLRRITFPIVMVKGLPDSGYTPLEWWRKTWCNGTLRDRTTAWWRKVREFEEKGCATIERERSWGLWPLLNIDGNPQSQNLQWWLRQSSTDVDAFGATWTPHLFSENASSEKMQY